MSEKIFTSLILAALVAVLGSACSPRPSQKDEMAAVNDENCKPESIARIEDKDAREKFGSMCFSRGKFKPSPKKEW